nr:MAG TPA: hypothetical protein [Caudoviricetes sp.]
MGLFFCFIRPKCDLLSRWVSEETPQTGGY